MISVLIPVYNYDVVPLVIEMHRQASQLALPFEILVLDDHSTAIILERRNLEIVQLPHVYYVRAETNAGRSATRKMLAEEARFDWLLFLDADIIPASANFLKEYIKHINEADLIFGGIAYEDDQPKDKELRWKYGQSREAQPVAARMKNPYLSVLSAVIFIKKNLFDKANDFLENRYGLDVLFTANLKRLQPKVLHINNPAIHTGLETNEEFLLKTEKAMESIAFFTKSGKIPPDHRGIQKVALRFRSLGLIPVFLKITELNENRIQKNLLSFQPSLRVFDLFRLRILLLNLAEND